MYNENIEETLVSHGYLVVVKQENKERLFVSIASPPGDVLLFRQ